MLLAFDATKLGSNASEDALLASVQVSTAPVGLAFVHDGSHIITADSNRFSTSNTTMPTSLSVVHVTAALEEQQGFPNIPTGQFAREMALSPSGNTLLVTQFGSNAIQAIDVSQLV